MGSGLSSGLGSGSTRARDYSDLFYHRGASQGSARGWLNSGLDLRLKSAWLGLALLSLSLRSSQISSDLDSAGFGSILGIWLGSSLS